MTNLFISLSCDRVLWTSIWHCQLPGRLSDRYVMRHLRNMTWFQYFNTVLLSTKMREPARIISATPLRLYSLGTRPLFSFWMKST